MRVVGGFVRSLVHLPLQGAVRTGTRALSAAGNSLADSLAAPELLRTRALVAGEWVHGGDGRRFQVLDPATGDTLAEVAACGLDEVNRAVVAGAAAQTQWQHVPAKQRGAVLRKWFDLMQEHEEDLATILSAESGKPLQEARGEVAYAASFLEWFAEEAKRSYGQVIPATSGDKRLLTIKQPLGVAAMITPWNFPAAMITRKVGPCLAAGNAAVLKPAEDTPLSALALAELAQQAGVPPGLFSVVTCPREVAAEVGERLCKHPQVAKLSFTGSTPVGVKLAEWCAQGIKRISLELGGNAPFIVFEDADIDVAVKALMASKFRNSGQTCVCSNRVLVHESIYDEFTTALTEATSTIQLGHGLSPGVTQGPLINQAGHAKVKHLVEEATAAGAKVMAGGAELAQDQGLSQNFFAPTVLTNVSPDMEIFQQEIFGPVAAVVKFSTEDEAVAMANNADVGLAAYFCSKDMTRIWRVAEALQVGMVGVNEGIISTEVAPFGGWKMSGLGREGASVGMDEYTELKYVCMGGIQSP